MRIFWAVMAACLAGCEAPPAMDLALDADRNSRPGFAAPGHAGEAIAQTAAPTDPTAEMQARIAALKARTADLRAQDIAPELRARLEARRALQ